MTIDKSVRVLLAAAVAAVVASGSASAFGTPSAEQRKALEAKAAAETAATKTEERTLYDGIYTSEQATKGRALYAQYCVSCHGNRGRGSPGSPGIVARVLNDKYADMPLSVYYDLMSQTMPKGQEGVLTDEQYADVLAFVLSLHGAPAGDSVLPADFDALDTIIIGPKPK